MKRRYQELEKNNFDLEQKLQQFQQKKQQFVEAQIEQEKITDLMWILASIPKPQFPTEKIPSSQYTIRKISPAFSEFLGFQETKQLINAKMCTILPSVPSQISHIHSDYVQNLSHKKDTSYYSKKEIFKTLYNEFYLSNLEITLYSNDSKPYLCIMVLTNFLKLDNLNLEPSHDSQEN